MPKTFYEELDFCDAFGDADNIQLNVTIAAFAELVSSDSRFRNQAGKHYKNAVRILKQQVHYILTGDHDQWAGYTAFDVIRKNLVIA